jgi:hypothetical protein
MQTAQELKKLFKCASCYLGDVFDAAALQPELIELYSTLSKLKGRRNVIRDYISLLGSRITGTYAGEDQVEIRAQGPALYQKLMELETRIKEVESQIKESKRRVVAAKPAAVVAEIVKKPSKRKAPQPKGHIETGFAVWNSKHVKKLCKRASKSRYPTPKEPRAEQ